MSLVLLHQDDDMTTRLYFSFSGLNDDPSTEGIVEAPIVPSSWSTGWNKTTGVAKDAFLRQTKSPNPTGTPANAGVGTSGQFTAIYRAISGPLLGQTISGNVKGQARWREAAATNNYTNAFAIKVIKPDGTDRGILLAVSASDDTSATPPEIPITTLTNRKFRDSAENTSIALSSLAVTEGDRLVVELGFRQASTDTGNGEVVVGGQSTDSDLAEDDTATAVANSWIEFDSTISFNPIAYYGSSSVPLDDAAATNVADPTAVTPPGGMASGDLVLMIGESRNSTATFTVSATGGQTWNALTPVIATTNQAAQLFWCTFNGTWSADPSIDFTGTVTSASVQMHVFRPPSGYTWSVNVALAELDDTTDPFTITGQTTTGSNPTVTIAGWFTADDNTWGTLSGTGWENLGYDQYRNTSGLDQSATYAMKFQTAAGATGNVSKSQLTLGPNDTTTFIVTFAAAEPALASGTGWGYGNGGWW